MQQFIFDTKKAKAYISENKIDNIQEKVFHAIDQLEQGSGKGNDFLGWLKLPSDTRPELVQSINEQAKKFREMLDYVVVVGIGGSYLGSRAVIESLKGQFPVADNSTEIIYAGQNICEDYLFELSTFLENKNFGIIVISKSGTTTEPAIAFRILKELLEKQVGKEASADRIIAITDEKKGALKQLADQNGYFRFIIPDNVGGRYSVLTPVGLLAIAIAGYDVQKLLKGAGDMEKQCLNKSSLNENPAARYAAYRFLLYQGGKNIEILANYTPKLHYFTEWWKQLFGESEGKEGKGIFPAGVDFTTDLHSMGQYIQDGRRSLFETLIKIDKPRHKLSIPFDQENLDKLNYLAGKDIHEVNAMACLGTQLAHVDGGVPNLEISIPDLNEYSLGQLIYFFEISCAISGYLLEINPFDQQGVEDYKRNMFALLGKPGFEELSKEIKNRTENF